MFSFATSVVPCAIKIKTDTGVSQLGFDAALVCGPRYRPRRSSAGDGRCIRILHAPVCWAVGSALENKKADIPMILNHKDICLIMQKSAECPYNS